MIPDFKTYISESVWGDMRRRAEGQSDRKENTYKFNIDDLKEIDLGPQVPFYWADFDLEANGEYYFDRDMVDDMLPQIKKTGWRLPYGPFELKNFIKTIKRFDDFEAEWHPQAFGMIKNTKTGAFVSFPTSSEYGQSYWAEDDYRKTRPEDTKYQPDGPNARSFDMGNQYYEDSSKMVLLSTNNDRRYKKLKIRLVKDK